MKEKSKKIKISFRLVVYFLIIVVALLVIIELSFKSNEGFVENVKLKYATVMDEKTQVVNDGSGKLLVIINEELDSDDEKLLREKVKEQYGTDDFIIQPSWEVIYKNAQKQNAIPIPEGYGGGY